jgi:hypothetical protein
MLYWIAFHCALYLAGINPGSTGPSSYLKSDEATWAKRLGLNPSYVSGIVKAAGFSEDDEVRIEVLDVHNLRARKHILLVTVAGNGHCLTLTVVARKTASMEKIWEASDFGGGGFCHDGARTGDFIARAAKGGVIVVDVPKDENGNYVLPGVKHLVYRWNGETYELSTRLEQ